MAGHSQFSLFRHGALHAVFHHPGIWVRLNDNIFQKCTDCAGRIPGQQRWRGLNTNQVVNFSALIFILPFFLFSALFGQFADKYEKSMQIRRIKLLEVVIMLTATLRDSG